MSATMALAVCFTTFASAPAIAVEEALLDGLEYRLIGPWRGGRVTAVTGVPGNPQLYYMGATGGGAWKTTNAGETWENISDGQIPVGTIGAVAVAESGPERHLRRHGRGPDTRCHVRPGRRPVEIH
ncbi:MAG: hypothetical protein U5K38_16700 [Woeseiaceae bacterium]|nr:hypothetical protein [Woeseiaceae bacterium]